MQPCSQLQWAEALGGVCGVVQAAARSHNAREAELSAREAAIDAAQQQVEQQSRQLQV